jgi:hypothetical protein
LPIGRCRVVPRGASKGRKLSLPDGLHDRLWLTARQQRTTVGAVAAGILDRHPPRPRIKGIAQTPAKICAKTASSNLDLGGLRVEFSGPAEVMEVARRYAQDSWRSTS